MHKSYYREFCQVAPDLPVFVQDWYLDAVCEGGEWDVALVRRGDQIVASMPYFLKRKAIFKYIAMPHFVKSMGPYVVPGLRVLKHEHELYQALLEQLPQVDCLKQDFHYRATNWLPFYWANYEATPRYTYVLDLDNLKTVFAGFNRNIRRNIKKAQAELKVIQGGSTEDFYRINKMSFERQNIATPYSYALFQKHDAALAAHDARQAFFAIDNQERIHSAAYLIWDKNSSYYHLSGDDPTLRNSGAGILLIWEAIQYTKNVLGLNTFDFEGSMMPNVERIRRQFGARQETYFRIWRYDSRLYKWLDTFL